MLLDIKNYLLVRMRSTLYIVLKWKTQPQPQQKVAFECTGNKSLSEVTLSECTIILPSSEFLLNLTVLYCLLNKPPTMRKSLGINNSRGKKTSVGGESVWVHINLHNCTTSDRKPRGKGTTTHYNLLSVKHLLRSIIYGAIKLLEV